MLLNLYRHKHKLILQLPQIGCQALFSIRHYLTLFSCSSAKLMTSALTLRTCGCPVDKEFDFSARAIACRHCPCCNRRTARRCHSQGFLGSSRSARSMELTAPSALPWLSLRSASSSKAITARFSLTGADCVIAPVSGVFCGGDSYGSGNCIRSSVKSFLVCGPVVTVSCGCTVVSAAGSASRFSTTGACRTFEQALQNNRPLSNRHSEYFLFIGCSQNPFAVSIQRGGLFMNINMYRYGRAGPQARKEYGKS